MRFIDHYLLAQKRSQERIGQGRVPLGYLNEDKKLIVEDKEAETVKLMFDLYQEHKNIRLVKEALDKRKIVSRIRINKVGLQIGGTSFSAGNIASILNNPACICLSYSLCLAH